MPAYNGEHEDAIRPFVDAMRVKLAMNRHKGRWKDLDLQTALKLLKAEVNELEEAISRGNTVEILLESADCGNFAMMVSNIAVKAAIAGQGSADFSHAEPPNTIAIYTHMLGVDHALEKSSNHMTDYDIQGVWQPNHDAAITMWRRKSDGLMVYADHQLVREAKLPVAPWTNKDDAHVGA